MSHPNDPRQQGWYTGGPGGGNPPVPGYPPAPGNAPVNPPGNAAGAGSKNGVGLWAMILGIVGFIVWPAGVVAIILGILGLRNLNLNRADNKGQTVTGLVLGIFTTIVGFIVSVAIVIALIVGIGATSQDDTGGMHGDSGMQGDSPAEPAQPGSGGDAGGQKASGQELVPGVTMELEPEASGKASEHAAPDRIQGQNPVFLRVHLRNSSDADFAPPYPLITCTYGGGAECPEVFDRSVSPTIDGTDKGFHSSVPAGKDLSFITAYAVPAEQMKSLHLKYEFAIDGQGRRALDFSAG